MEVAAVPVGVHVAGAVVDVRLRVDAGAVEAVASVPFGKIALGEIEVPAGGNFDAVGRAPRARTAVGVGVVVGVTGSSEVVDVPVMGLVVEIVDAVRFAPTAQGRRRAAFAAQDGAGDIGVRAARRRRRDPLPIVVGEQDGAILRIHPNPPAPAGRFQFDLVGQPRRDPHGPHDQLGFRCGQVGRRILHRANGGRPRLVGRHGRRRVGQIHGHVFAVHLIHGAAIVAMHRHAAADDFQAVAQLNHAVMDEPVGLGLGFFQGEFAIGVRDLKNGRRVAQGRARLGFGRRCGGNRALDRNRALGRNFELFAAHGQRQIRLHVPHDVPALLFRRLDRPPLLRGSLARLTRSAACRRTGIRHRFFVGLKTPNVSGQKERQRKHRRSPQRPVHGGPPCRSARLA